jgi:hypothetical protein
LQGQEARAKTEIFGMETRETVPLVAPDLSQFARALGRSLKDRHAAGSEPPGHVELMNLLARAAGHRNLQALRAAALKPLPRPADSPDEPLAVPVLGPNARKALTQFDARGRLVRWPHKFSVQRLAMWTLWTRFDGRRAYTEREVNEILKAWHTYGDHATLRRELINHKLMARKSDCSEYWKLPARPDEETRWFLHAWRRMTAQVSPAEENAAGSTAARRSTR